MKEIKEQETKEQAALSSLALTLFKVNGQFIQLADTIAAPAGLTATKWQVLGSVLSKPLTIPDVAREMGITRQSVRRTVQLLLKDGLLELHPNPAHQTAKLLKPTTKGYEAIQRLEPHHKKFAQQLANDLDLEKLEAISTDLLKLSTTIERLQK